MMNENTRLTPVTYIQNEHAFKSSQDNITSTAYKLLQIDIQGRY